MQSANINGGDLWIIYQIAAKNACQIPGLIAFRGGHKIPLKSLNKENGFYFYHQRISRAQHQ
jgi:hypothetical protein